jgi:hypothetical protein
MWGSRLMLQKIFGFERLDHLALDVVMRDLVTAAPEARHPTVIGPEFDSEESAAGRAR